MYLFHCIFPVSVYLTFLYFWIKSFTPTKLTMPWNFCKYYFTLHLVSVLDPLWVFTITIRNIMICEVAFKSIFILEELIPIFCRIIILYIPIIHFVIKMLIIMIFLTHALTINNLLAIASLSVLQFVSLCINKDHVSSSLSFGVSS